MSCEELQIQLNLFLLCCEEYHLALYICKSKVIHFTEKQECVGNDYTVQNIGIEASTEIKDLGIIFYSMLIFRNIFQ